ncbi:MAG: hypothetical protein NC079_06315 [Clostridium sp.]|nr:hypothetical protein [Acetatifactor muris]MCM1526428.1 hypothetical protein [Bacteroides sp.]MCM1563209.1 hypothetical protein [Clostridium sp.]
MSGREDRSIYDGDRARRREAAMRLFEALSGVDEEYLAAGEAEVDVEENRAENTGRRADRHGAVPFLQRYGKAVAAALCLAVLGASYLSLRYGVIPRSADSSGGMARDMNGAPAWESAAEAQMYDTAPMAVAQSEGNFAGGAAEDGAAGIGYAQSPEAAAGAANDGVDQQLALNGVENQKGNVTTELTEKSKEGLQVMIDDTSATTASKEITVRQAQQYAVVGAFLPTVWPADGEVTAVYGDDTAGQESVTFRWTYGNQWDDFTVTVQNLGEDVPDYVTVSMADKAAPETCDDPVFRAEDFDRDCVEARIVSNGGDRGDTDTPRGRFAVLYQSGEEYVLVSFNGRGSTEEIWEMMDSVGE